MSRQGRETPAAGQGQGHTLDAIEAARAALSSRRVAIAKDRTGAIEALRVLRTTRQTAIKVRRSALLLLRTTVVAAPDEVREQLRRPIRMQLIRTCDSMRPDLIDFRDPVVAPRIALCSIAKDPGRERRDRLTRSTDCTVEEGDGERTYGAGDLHRTADPA